MAAGSRNGPLGGLRADSAVFPPISFLVRIGRSFSEGLIAPLLAEAAGSAVWERRCGARDGRGHTLSLCRAVDDEVRVVHGLTQSDQDLLGATNDKSVAVIFIYRHASLEKVRTVPTLKTFHRSTPIQIEGSSLPHKYKEILFRGDALDQTTSMPQISAFP